MKNILTKILQTKKKNNYKDLLFLEIQKTTKVAEIFKAVLNYDSKSEIRFVGGCVRKILNNEKFDDIDLATNLNPNQIKKCLEINNIKYFDIGIKHGTITAHINNKNFEITSLRKDIKTDGRHALVEFTNDWRADASRRDFTINSIYSDLEGNLFDPNDGLKDLKNGYVKFIGDPEKRIKEDYLRILRYLRFFINYSKHDHENNIKKIIKQNITGAVNLSKERLLDELKKIVLSKGFLNLNKDSFSKELLLLIFPQLKHIKIFNNLSKYSQSILIKKDFIFLLSLLIIDESDNSEYFLYKFNLSNEAKRRISFLKDFFGKKINSSAFSKNNLQKVFYFHGKSDLIDLIDFYFIKLRKKNNKLAEVKKYFEKIEKPVFPIKAEIVMKKYRINEGKELGQKLKSLENLWVENNFKISDKDVDKVFLN
tara:strand:- start:556 stop:1830 length:1275 start_codon:yes stop_codon:yes gene_type:complete